MDQITCEGLTTAWGLFGPIDGLLENIVTARASSTVKYLNTTRIFAILLRLLDKTADMVIIYFHEELLITTYTQGKIGLTTYCSCLMGWLAATNFCACGGGMLLRSDLPWTHQSITNPAPWNRRLSPAVGPKTAVAPAWLAQNYPAAARMSCKLPSFAHWEIKCCQLFSQDIYAPWRTKCITIVPVLEIGIHILFWCSTLLAESNTNFWNSRQ